MGASCWRQLAAADLVISTTGAERADRHARSVSTRIEARCGSSGRCSSSTWPCRAISIRPSASGPTSISTRSTTSPRPASGTASARDRELPAAEQIIEHETDALHGRPAPPRHGPVIRRLTRPASEPRRAEEAELERLFNKLPDLDERARAEIRSSSTGW